MFHYYVFSRVLRFNLFLMRNVVFLKVSLTNPEVFPGLFVITRNQSDVYGRNLVEIDPTSLRHLSKQLRDQSNSQKTRKT